ncbi:MAG TPA: glycosyltransferase, partial [Longimicrobiales bacterium]|nr:glycosyltransferase [Longimicrobiales bacterium]
MAGLSVLITADAYPPEFRGGGEEIVRRTTAGLREAGARVHVLTAGTPAESIQEGVRVSRVRGGRYALNAARRRIGRYAAAADIVHTFTYHSCLPSLLA